MKSIDLNINAQKMEAKSIPNYDRKDFKEEMIEALGVELFDACNEFDSKMALVRSHTTNKLKVANNVLDAALESYGRNHGMGRLADYVFSQIEKVKK